MIVFHAIWNNLVAGKLHIWAESSNLPLTTKKRSSKQGDGQKAPPHPFTLTHDTLMEALGDISGSLLVNSASSGYLMMRLPSTAKGPQPSPELLVEHETVDPRGIEFKAWNIATLTLDPGPALDFLLGLPMEPPHGVAFSSALRFWATAARFSYELISRQCFMPALEEIRRDGTLTMQARWKAVLAPEDADRLSLLSTLMPPLCWAFLPPGEKKSSLLHEMVQHFLDQAVDAYVRESLSSTELLPTRGRRSGSRVRGTSDAAALPEQWLRALSSADPTLTASPEELKLFVTGMQSWLGQLQPAAPGAPFRTCFRLDPPGGDSAEWGISFHLQANDDRSLLVPADQVWKERSSTLTFLKRKFENPQERLLADLGKASRLFPAIEESLKTARPRSLKLNTEQAYLFLRQSAPLLEQSGFGVLVPPWWQKPSSRLKARLKIKPGADANVSSGLVGLNSIIAYDWNVAIGDTTLTADEFEKLVSLKLPLVQMRGQWVELRPEEIEAAIAFFKKKHSNGTMSLGEALQLGLGEGLSDAGLPVEGLEGEGWIRELLEKLADGVKINTIEQPLALRGKLRPYQLKGVSWLAFLKQFGLGACLADDMGLGKCLAASSQIFINSVMINALGVSNDIHNAALNRTGRGRLSSALNGTLQKAEDIWGRYVGETLFDGEGYWSYPTRQLLVNSIDEATGQIVQAPVKRLYRQYVSEPLRRVQLEDGSSVTITLSHKLLTDKGWTNDLHIGDYVAHVRDLLEQEVYYSSIKEIEAIAYDGWVYDFEVEGYHNFVANNFLCHNTIQLISLFLSDRESAIQKPSGPSLIICPMSIVGNWHRELQRFAPSLSIMVHHGHERLSGEAFADVAKQHDVVITTYGLALRDKEHLLPIEWECVVLDEAQNIKNESAKQTQAIKQLNTRHRIALTGTPVENRLAELWSIMEFLNPGYLGSGKEFRTKFALPIEKYHNEERAGMLKHVVQPFVLRRLKTDKTIIQDLPDKLEMKVFCNLTQEQASLYEAVVKEMMEKIEQAEGIERKGLVLATLMKLKQVCNHPAHFVADGSSLPGRSGKLERLEEMLEEVLAAGDKALIFTQFAEMGSMLRPYLQERLGAEVLFLHGGTLKHHRDAMVQRFQEERRGAPIFLLSLKAGGVGLNLTAANHVFHFDRWWNPAVENQATDRAFRIGQQKNVQVHKFVCVGTLEERIDQMIEQKKELAESVVGGGESWLTEMSTSQLKELFALSREAVGE